MTVTDKFKNDSAMAAIRALRGLEQTAIMLEKWGPEVFPEVNEAGQKHFGRIMMEGAAQAIRDAWAAAIKEAENAQRAEHVDETEKLRDALAGMTGLVELITARDDLLADIKDAMLQNHRFQTATQLLSR
jgi:hypothetical protein